MSEEDLHSTPFKMKMYKDNPQIQSQMLLSISLIAKKAIYFLVQVTTDCFATKDTLQYIFLSWPETTQKITFVKSRVDSWTTQISVHSNRTVIVSSFPSR